MLVSLRFVWLDEEVGDVVEQFQSPLEITTLFLLLSIGFYVFLFWRSQMQSSSYSRSNRRKDGHRPQIYPRRRASDRNFSIDETDPRSATNH